MILIILIRDSEDQASHRRSASSTQSSSVRHSVRLRSTVTADSDSFPSSSVVAAAAAAADAADYPRDVSMPMHSAAGNLPDCQPTEWPTDATVVLWSSVRHRSIAGHSVGHLIDVQAARAQENQSPFDNDSCDRVVL